MECTERNGVKHNYKRNKNSLHTTQWLLVICLFIILWKFSDWYKPRSEIHGSSENPSLYIDKAIYKNNYGYYRVPKFHSRPAIDMIKAGRVYEQATLNFIKKMHEPGTDIVHAGAYFGDMLPFLASIAKDSLVWAFEPVFLHAECAKRNIELNNVTNVLLFNVALSNHSQKVQMETKCDGKYLGGGTTIKAVTSNRCQYESVDCAPLDSYLFGMANRVSVLHLDVEGHELAALEGSRRLILRDRPMIMVEIWKGRGKVQATEEYLHSINYKRKEQVDGNTVFSPIP